jgi:hypothetical protein
MRFSLFNLFLAIAMAGVLCASVISITGYWLAVLYTLTLLLFSVTGLRSMGLRQPQRAFAIAFAISGGVYLILANCTTMFARSSLLTNYPLALIAREFQVPLAVDRVTRLDPVSGATGSVAVAPVQTVTVSVGPTLPLDLVINRAYGSGESEILRFFFIGHCVWSWIIGAAFGWAAVKIYGKRKLE